MTVRILRSLQPITVGVYMIEIPEDSACPHPIVVYALVVSQGGISHIVIYGSVCLLLQVDVIPYQQSLLTWYQDPVPLLTATRLSSLMMR